MKYIMQKNIQKSKTKILLLVLLAIMLLVSATGCIPGNGSNSLENPAGFFSGIWHGWIAPISLIISFFNEEITIFENFNNGFLYNLGFYMAVISPFGGLSLKRKDK